MKLLLEYRKNYQECLDLKRSGKGNADIFWETLNQSNNTINLLLAKLEEIKNLSNYDN